MNENLRNFNPAPDAEVWGNIEKTMRRRAIRRQAISGGVAAVIVSGLIAGVVLWPTRTSDTASATAASQTVVAMVAENNAEQVAQVANASEEMDVLAVVAAGDAKVGEKVDNKVSEAASPVKVNVTMLEDQPVANAEREAADQVKAVAVKSAAPVAPVASVAPVAGVAGVAPVAGVAAKQEAAVNGAVEEVVAEAKNEEVKGSGLVKTIGSNAVEEDTILWIPNGFIPSQGQTFHVIMNKEASSVKNFRMAIFNRQGHQVFHSTDINMAWDGTYKGREMPKAAYVCVVSYTDRDGLTHQRKATVLLVR